MRSPHRGDIYRMKEDAVGKPRRVIVVSRNELNSGIYVLAVPFYGDESGRHAYKASCVTFEDGEFGCTKKCVAKTHEILMLRLTDLRISEGPIDRLSPEKMAEIEKGLAYSLNLKLSLEPSPQGSVTKA